MKINDELFKSEQQKLDAITSLNSLKTHPGWAIVRQILDLNISVLTETLLTSDFDDLDEHRELKRRRQAYIDARDTPDTLIAQFTNKAESAAPNFDPYAPDYNESLKPQIPADQLVAQSDPYSRG